jgi:hypothetical protein
MKWKQILVCASSLILSVSAATKAAARTAADSEMLLPESGILFEPGPGYQYQELLRQLFLENRPAQLECQMIVGSGFGGRNTEEAVIIERDRQGEHPTVVFVSTTADLADALMRSLVERDRGGKWQAILGSLSQKISEQRAPLANATADTLSELCEMMLGTVRYPQDQPQHVDGGEVHFAHFDPDHGYRAGKGTIDKGRVGAYVRVLEQLGRVAAARPADRPVEEKRARDLATALIADLEKTGLSVPDVQRERRSRSAVLPLPPGSGGSRGTR